MPNGRPGTLIEISFLIEGTYLVVKAWEGRGNQREERKAGRRERALRLFSSGHFPLTPQTAFYLNHRPLFIRAISQLDYNYCGIVRVAYILRGKKNSIVA